MLLLKDLHSGKKDGDTYYLDVATFLHKCFAALVTYRKPIVAYSKASVIKFDKCVDTGRIFRYSVRHKLPVFALRNRHYNYRLSHCQ